jgi:hypothetical protein
MAKENHIARLYARHSTTANPSIQSALEPVLASARPSVWFTPPIEAAAANEAQPRI